MKKQIKFENKELENQIKKMFLKKSYFVAKHNEISLELQKLLVNHTLPNINTAIDKYGTDVTLYYQDLLTEDEKLQMNFEQAELLKRLLNEGYLEKHK